jgi:hypothetical protein
MIPPNLRWAVYREEQQIMKFKNYTITISLYLLSYNTTTALLKSNYYSRHIRKNVYERTLHRSTQHWLSASSKQVHKDPHSKAKTRICSVQSGGRSPGYFNYPRETRESEKHAKHGTNPSVSRSHGAVWKSCGSAPQFHAIPGLCMGTAIL